MAFGRCSRGHNRSIRWVEPVFVQITYNGKVLVERMKVFPNGSQRVHATVLAEKKAGSFLVHIAMLTHSLLLTYLLTCLPTYLLTYLLTCLLTCLLHLASKSHPIESN
jgi:hypothetical protein